MADEFAERRRYFRVNDTINLHHKVIDEVELDKLSHISNDILSNCSLATALDVINHDARNLLLRLERREPEIVEYLKIIDSKINLIAQAIILESEQFQEHDAHDVVLSATGMAFSNEVPLAIGLILELRMLLTSCMAVVVAMARVVHCKEYPDNVKNPFYICVEYINLKEDDRELLIKHVVKKQLQQLRDKHEQ